MNRTSTMLGVLWLASMLVLVVFAFVDAGNVSLYYSNIAQTVVALASGMLCFAAAEAFPAHSPLRRSWLLIGAGTMAWGIGSAIFAGFPILNGGEETPYPYFSDLGFLLTSPLIALGLYTFKRSAGLQAPAGGVALALFLLLVGGYWCYQTNAEDLLEGDLVTRLAALGYIIFDPILLAVAALTASSFRGGAIGKAWWFVLAGSVAYVFGNQIYAYLTVLDAYRTGSLWDLTWILAFGLIAWGSISARNMMR